MEHENLLTNHRLTWLLTSQGFLFAAFILVFQKAAEVTTGDMRFQYLYILAGLAFAGCLISFHLHFGLRAAEDQHEHLRAWWVNRGAKRLKHPDICGHNPRILAATLPYSVLPFFFMLAWGICIFVALQPLFRPYSRQVAIALLLIAMAAVMLTIGIIIGKKMSSRTVAQGGSI